MATAIDLFCSKNSQPVALTTHREEIDLISLSHCALCVLAINTPKVDWGIDIETNLAVKILITKYESRMNMLDGKFKKSGLLQIIQRLMTEVSSSNTTMSSKEASIALFQTAERFIENQAVKTGITIFQRSFALTKNEQELASEKYTYMQKNINCLEFALYHQNVKKTDSEEAFFDLEFDEIQNPEAGDLVVYGNKKGNYFDQKHLGIYSKKGQVISKWGSNQNIFIHGLEGIKSSYGNSVRFFRKKHRFECQVTSLSSLHELVVGNIPHSIIYTAKGLQERFVRIFKEASKKNLEVVFERSMFGQGALRVYRKTALSNLREFDASGLSRGEYLEQTRVLVNQTANDQPVFIHR